MTVPVMTCYQDMTGTVMPLRLEPAHAPAVPVGPPEELVRGGVVGHREVGGVPVQLLPGGADGDRPEQDGLGHRTGLFEVGFVLRLPPDRIDQVVIVVTRLELGRLRARKLLLRFGSLKGIAAAKEEEVSDIVGPAVAKSVIDFLDMKMT